MFALIVIVPPTPVVVSVLLTATPSTLDRRIVPVPVPVAPPMVSVFALLVSAMLPAPVAVAVKLAPSVSVMNTPPESAVAMIVLAVVLIGARFAPIPLPAALAVRVTVLAVINEVASRMLPNVDVSVTLPATALTVPTLMLPTVFV